MSRRTSEANKAILAAWKKEQDLVRDGKGTRDWTQEQQQDILDRGKAYDNSGKAFEGQHMKSVEKYPEYQSDPNNIQFLTKAEHLEAHQGNWQNPTNWYFDPATKQFLDFGKSGLIPCKIIELSNPIITMNTPPVDTGVELFEQTEKEQSSGADPPIMNLQQSAATTSSVPSNISIQKNDNKVSDSNVQNENVLKRFANGAGEIARKVRKLAFEHNGIIGFAVTVGTAIWAAVSSSDSNASGNSDSGSDDKLSYYPSFVNENKKYDYSDTSCSEEHSSPREHEVPGHSQRYHTKNGVVVKEKEPYHRGGKKDE